MFASDDFCFIWIQVVFISDSMTILGKKNNCAGKNLILKNYVLRYLCY